MNSHLLLQGSNDPLVVNQSYQLILHNQRYYLMCRHDFWGNLTFYRVDHITNAVLTDVTAVPITALEGYENGINYYDLKLNIFSQYS